MRGRSMKRGSHSTFLNLIFFIQSKQVFFLFFFLLHAKVFFSQSHFPFCLNLRIKRMMSGLLLDCRLLEAVTNCRRWCPSQKSFTPPANSRSRGSIYPRQDTNMFQLIQIKDRNNQGHSLSVKAVILFNSADLWAWYLPSEVMRSIYCMCLQDEWKDICKFYKECWSPDTTFAAFRGYYSSSVSVWIWICVQVSVRLHIISSVKETILW